MQPTTEPGSLEKGTRVLLRDGRTAVVTSVVPDGKALLQFDDGQLGAQPVAWLTPIPPDQPEMQLSVAPA